MLFYSSIVIQKADIYTIFLAAHFMKTLLKLICIYTYTVSHRYFIKKQKREKPCSTNSFPICVFKHKQLLYLPLTSVWVLLNASSKVHSMNISFSHVCWNPLAKYVLFYILMEKKAKNVNRQLIIETKQMMDSITKNVQLP